MQLAQSITFKSANVSLTSTIQRYSQPAGALGADQNAKSVTDSKTRFDKASAALRGDLGESRDQGASRCFRGLGVEFVVLNNLVGGFFESLSWENVAR
ncbi:MAG TPA: hypothetical protein VGM75_33335 [Pseudonocardiaceae bacterium]